MNCPQQVTVIGGGAIGLSLAWELSRRGVELTVIQRDEVRESTSWSAAGILPPANFRAATDPLDRLRGLGHQLYPDWISELEATTQMDVGFRRCGGWYLANTPGEKASMIGMTGYWNELGIQCESVPLADVAVREPALESWTRSKRSAHASAWWAPDEWQVRPPRLLAALRKACESTGVNFIDRANVDHFESTSAGARCRIHQRWHTSDVVVLCAGAWSGQLATNQGLARSVIPIRGQMLLLKSQDEFPRGIVNIGHRYLVPRDDGYLLVGSCEEETGFELGTTATMVDSLHEFAIELLPSLRDAERAATWSGLRPMTYDGFPMIGRIPDQPSLCVAAGHFRSGWHLAPATARCLSDLILGQLPEVSLDAFSVGKQQIKSESRWPLSAR